MNGSGEVRIYNQCSYIEYSFNSQNGIKTRPGPSSRHTSPSWVGFSYSTSKKI